MSRPVIAVLVVAGFIAVRCPALSLAAQPAQPVQQIAKLVPTDGGPHEYFGISSAVKAIGSSSALITPPPAAHMPSTRRQVARSLNFCRTTSAPTTNSANRSQYQDSARSSGRHRTATKAHGAGPLTSST